MSRLPNFIYIGTSKAGSTWLYDVLNRHPDIYMAPGKGLYFFSSHYERGLEWYRMQFGGASGERIVGEVSHTYMYNEKVCARIAAMNPNIRLMVCLREPVDRAFSDYLDGVKNNQIQGSFETELTRDPVFVTRGHYAKYLAPYVAKFGRERIHVGSFDELVSNPNEFARKVFEFLSVEPLELSAKQRERIMPAGKPRSRFLTQLAKRASHAARTMRLRKLRGKVKTSRLIRSWLYRQYEPEERPSMRPETRQELRESLREEMHRLDALLGTNFRELWEYR